MAEPVPAALLQRFDVSRESLAQLQAYVELLLIWQARINLIGPSTADQIWHRHVADAFQLMPLLPMGLGPLADLGSGAGIPGLIIAIASRRHVHLYESNGKKAAFLREAIRLTGAPATVHAIRIETLAEDANRPKVAAVMARALAPLTKLIVYAEPFLRDGAVGLFHKGQDVDVELSEATSYWKMLYEKHSSPVDSKGVIVVLKEISRVQPGAHA